MFLASFPLRWKYGVVGISVLMAALMSIGIAGILALLWFRAARKKVAEAARQHHQLMTLKREVQRDAHLIKLKAAQSSDEDTSQI